MDILIFDMGGDTWGFATPDPTGRALAPFGIDGAFLSYRLWPDENLRADQWDAAKVFFLRLAGDLRKPGHRANKKARAA